MMDSVEELFEKDVEFAAAPDVFPPDKFNAGVLLIVSEANSRNQAWKCSTVF